MFADRTMLVATALLLTGMNMGCGGNAQDGGADAADKGDEALGSGGTDGADGTGGAESGGSDGQEPWRTETDPVELCWALDAAFCDQFIECYGPDFSTNICTEDPSTHVQCSLVSAVSDDYIACMEVLTAEPCIGAQPAICADVVEFK